MSNTARSYSKISKRKHRFDKSVFAYIILLMVVIGILFIRLFGIQLIQSFNRKTYTVEVTSLDSHRTRNKDKWMVFAKDVSTGELYEFENTDNIFLKKVNSSHLQNRLTEGRIYEIEAAGYRLPLFSWYPNIISANEKVNQK